MIIELRWTDRRGAYHTRLLDRETADAIWHRLDTLRCEAELFAGGERIGGVDDLDARLGTNHDDRRRRWNSWLDKSALEQALAQVATAERLSGVRP